MSNQIFSDSTNVVYDSGPVRKDTSFDATGTTLAAGDYTLEVNIANMPGGGAFATYDGLTLEGTAIPEPSSTTLLGLGALTLILRRRK